MSSIIAPEFLQHANKHFLASEQEQDFVAACSRPLRKSIRVNRLKNSVTEFKSIMASYGINLQAIPWCEDGFWISESITTTAKIEANYLKNIDKIGLWPEHLQGRFYIQEASSMLPPIALLGQMENSGNNGHNRKQPQNPIKLLDMAAAPGSKTTQIAAMLDNQGLILANELSASRLKGLHANLVRCGVMNACLSQFDGRKLADRLAGLFDFVLLDAPCGGEGTVRKDPSALANWTEAQLVPLAKLQKQLIACAYQCLKPGGRLVYSTCSLSPQENQQVVLDLVDKSDAQIASLADLFIGAEKSLTKHGFLLVLPQFYDSEGFFVAAITKPIDSPIQFYPPQAKKHFVPLNKRVKVQFEQMLISHFGLDLSSFNSAIMQRDKEIWLMPQGYETVNQVMRLNRSGIKLADCYPNKFRLTHEFASCFYLSFKRQKLPLDLIQAKYFYQGKDLTISEQQLKTFDLLQGEVLLTYQDCFIGLANLQKLKIKNRLPRDRVIDRLNWLVDA